MLNQHNPRNSKPSKTDEFDVLEDWLRTEGMEKFIACLATMKDDKYARFYIELMNYFKAKPKPYDNRKAIEKRNFKVTIESPAPIQIEEPDLTNEENETED